VSATVSASILAQMNLPAEKYSARIFERFRKPTPCFARGRIRLPNRSKPAAGTPLKSEDLVSEVAAYMDRRSSRQHSFPPLLQSGVRHHFRFNIGANELVGRSIFGPQIRAFQETGTIVCPRKIKSSNLARPRCRAASEIRRPRQRVAAYMDRRSSRQHPILRRLQ
tara:strand:+ start:860 stop:1357 length:498 start_codon:yes stop_codon:yes gene_type:complete